MTAIKTLALLGSVATVSLFSAGLALADGEQPDPSKHDNVPKEIWLRIQQQREGLLAIDDSDAARGVYSTIEQWPPTYPKLRVCFFGGPVQTRQQIAEAAKSWESAGMGIKLDFGDMNDPRICGQGDGRDNQIRVSYDKPGFYSLVGQDSVNFAKQEEASLNLEGFDKLEPGKVLSESGKGIARHEFGHAIGLLHEHQSPEAHCDFNWNVIYDYLKGPPNNWPKEQIDFNMQPIDTAMTPGIMVTDFDKASIMLYQFPEKYYTQGAQSHCFIPAQNTEISQVDREVIEYMYPANPQSRIERFDQRKQAFVAIWNKAADDKKGVMMDMVKAFFESPGTANE